LGDNPFLAIRPEKILFESRLENSFDGVVEDVNFMGATSRYSVNVSGFLLSVETSKHPEIKKGDEVGVYLPPEDLMHFSGFNMEEELKII
jgi:ABC-type Fe3+/spermidine/putrescine transport system ATPase subunit